MGVRPEASRRPGQKPWGSPGTNGHMDGHAAGNMVPTCAGTQRALPWSQSWASSGRVAAPCPGNARTPQGTGARHPPRTPRFTRGDGLGTLPGPPDPHVGMGWGAGALVVTESQLLEAAGEGGQLAPGLRAAQVYRSVPVDKGPPLPAKHTCSSTGLTGPWPAAGRSGCPLQPRSVLSLGHQLLTELSDESYCSAASPPPPSATRQCNRHCDPGRGVGKEMANWGRSRCDPCLPPGWAWGSES